MIPANNGFLSQDFTIEEQVSRTYRMDIDKLHIRGFTDQLEAMTQAVYKIINTERYSCIIYSRNYGIELVDLYGQPMTYVLPELKRRITEALIQDSRITSVDAFNFAVEKQTILCTFTVHTIYGDIIAERAVNF